jgi:predicted RNA binding protein YcfA (HicA-like mRNA interferase family)
LTVAVETLTAPLFSPLRQPRVTAGELLRALRRAGFREIRTSGSHIRLRSRDSQFSVTVPGHTGVILKPKTLHAILEQAGLTVDQFRELL